MAQLRRWRAEQDVVKRPGPAGNGAKKPRKRIGRPPEPEQSEPADAQLQRAVDYFQQLLDAGPRKAAA